MMPLKLIDFPLKGMALIEASAGTGKTYALANLYLRYLLECHYTVEQILVVTFTEAATQELKDRIRQRIQDLRRVFEGEASTDPVFLHLLAQSSSIEADILALRLAERQMDQAKIHTIHGFCQQLLKTHALEAGVPLQQALLEDQTQLRRTVIEDFWRRYVLPLPNDALIYIIGLWSEPGVLQQSLAPMLNRSPEKLLPEPSAQGLDDWLAAFNQYCEWFRVLKNTSLTMIDEVIALLNEKPLKRNAFKLNWLAEIKAWAETPGLIFKLPIDKSKKEVFPRFTTSSIIAETPKGKVSPEHPFFAFLETHLSLVLPDVRSLFLAQSYVLVERMMKDSKRQQGVFSFDDLISRVAEALSADTLSAESVNRQQMLAQRIAEPYRVALIDEFQDTDPAQYHIFSTLFGVNSPNQEGSLVLIGDPKQAIYGFRGGDIATYLKAKKDMQQHPRGQVFTMDTNWRSSPSMVGAVNHVFDRPENAFMAEEIPFQPVNAGLSASGNLPKEALIISHLSGESLTKAQIEQSLAEHCVQQIQHLLMADYVLPGEPMKKLRHSDIAILVRSAHEGERMQNALANCGLSATLDSQASIYLTDEALALNYLLAAVADPRDEEAIRRCLAEPFFGISDDRILAFNEQATVFATYIHVFEQLHRLWQVSGVLAMVREALKMLGVFEFWHRQADARAYAHAARFWERKLTNWNQLAEILQKQSRREKGHLALLRWYQDTLSAVLSGYESSKGDNETSLRLESDAQLIRITTIHKSKGLEYPFVFIPFLFSCRGAEDAWFYNDEGALTLDLAASEESLYAAEAERLAEDIRLLYVALTRAKYQCFIGTATYQSNQKKSLGLAHTAWAYLIWKAQVPVKIDDSLLGTILSELAVESDGLVRLELISAQQQQSANAYQSDGAEYPEDEMPPALMLRPQQLSRPIADDWRVQSFTGLMHESQRLKRNADAMDGGYTSASLSVSTPPASELSIFSFPKGAQAGTFLHTLFEHLEFTSGELNPGARAQYGELAEFIRDKLNLSRLVEDQHLDAWSDYLTRWVRKVIQSPLLQGVSLSSLEKDTYVAELQFYFSVKKLQSVRFNYLLKKYGISDDLIEFASFEGHIKGAIDLVFKANKQYFILDYKSNHLGDTPQDYQREALQNAIQSHRYDVQYVIYSLALHRFLKQRLNGHYQYQRDFGGVLYLFLRGLRGEVSNADNKIADGSSCGVYFIRPPEALILQLDDEIGQL